MTGLDAIMEQIERAARTLRHMPPARATQKLSSWPEFIRQFFDAYGYTEASYRITPTARQISELDEVIGWLAEIRGTTAKIIWARAEGFSWRKIGRQVGLDPKTCKERFRIGIVAILFLKQKKKDSPHSPFYAMFRNTIGGISSHSN